MQTFILLETGSWLVQRDVLILSKFLSEKGIKDGFVPLKSIKVEIDGTEITYEQLQNIDSCTIREIEITRPDKDDEIRPF